MYLLKKGRVSEEDFIFHPMDENTTGLLQGILTGRCGWMDVYFKTAHPHEYGFDRLLLIAVNLTSKQCFCMKLMLEIGAFNYQLVIVDCNLSLTLTL